MKHFILVVVMALSVVSCATSSQNGLDPIAPEAPSTGGVGAEDAGPPESVAATPVETSVPSPSTTSPTTGPAITDGGQNYVWTVIAVEWNDVLNVRGDPDAGSPIEATLDPWSTEFVASLATEETGNGRWRQVVTSDGEQGWVNARFVVAQPVSPSDETLDHLVPLTEQAIDWVMTGSGSSPDEWLTGTGLWVGGIGVYADGHNGWEWLPRSAVDEPEDWATERTFAVPTLGPVECGSFCDKTLIDYLRVNWITESSEFLLDDIATPGGGFYDGQLYNAPSELHRVVINEAGDPESDPVYSWLRLHVVFDWSDGEPRIALMQTWGWTP